MFRITQYYQEIASQRNDYLMERYISQSNVITQKCKIVNIDMSHSIGNTSQKIPTSVYQLTVSGIGGMVSK